MLKCCFVFLGTCVTEKIHILGKLHSGLSYNAVVCNFNVNGSTIYIYRVVFKHTQWVDENANRSLQEPNSVFPSEEMIQHSLI